MFTTATHSTHSIFWLSHTWSGVQSTMQQLLVAQLYWSADSIDLYWLIIFYKNRSQCFMRKHVRIQLFFFFLGHHLCTVCKNGVNKFYKLSGPIVTGLMCLLKGGLFFFGHDWKSCILFASYNDIRLSFYVTMTVNKLLSLIIN